MSPRLRAGWTVAVGLAVASRLVDALCGPVLRGFDSIAHVSYVFFLDVYRALPFADQGWLYFHPPLHYALAWILAQTGSPEVFVRGLALWNGALSLGIAAMSAAVVRIGLPQRPNLPLLTFCAVAFLPAQVYASPMPGNELTVAFFGVAALAHHLGNQRRRDPSLARDLATGALAGAALLTKYNGLLALLAISAQLVLRAVRPGLDRPARTRLGLRLALIVGVAALLSGGYYARNAAEFGTPLPMKGHRPVLDAYESRQPPGERTWLDLVSISPRLLIDPAPLAPHMVHSIWGTFYAGLWTHLDRPGSTLPVGATRTLLLMGLVPTALALCGLLLSACICWRERDAHVDTTLVLLTAGGLLAFMIFVFGTPTFAAVKPMYLLSLSPAYGFFLARAVAALAIRPKLQIGAVVAVLGACLASASIFTALAMRPAAENVQMAFVRHYFGDHERAAAVYRRELSAALEGAEAGGGRLNPLWARGMLAAVELSSGHPGEARRLYAESLEHRQAANHVSPFALNRLAVATALAGDPTEARQLLDRALSEIRATELLVNRGALRALAGDWVGAEADLREALVDIPRLAPALANLAWVLEQRGDPDAAALRASAVQAAHEAPRYYPYGVGDGQGLNNQRSMLELRAEGLKLYVPARAHPR